MTRTSIIRYPRKSKSVVIRETLVTLCIAAPDPNCAAAILNQLIYWTDVKIAAATQAKYHNEAAAREGKEPTQDESLWIYKDFAELQDELLNLFGRNKLINNMAWLVESGYLQKRMNPVYRWDKTAQYRADTDLIQSRIEDVREFKIKRSKGHKQTLKSPGLNPQTFEIKPAIPEITSETTPEITTERTTSAPAAQDAGDAPSKHKVDPVFDIVAEKFFGAKPGDASAIKRIRGRAGKLVSFLKERELGTPDGIALYLTWHARVRSNLSLPKDDVKFATSWLEFEAAPDAQPIEPPAAAPAADEAPAVLNPPEWMKTAMDAAADAGENKFDAAIAAMLKRKEAADKKVRL